MPHGSVNPRSLALAYCEKPAQIAGLDAWTDRSRLGPSGREHRCAIVQLMPPDDRDRAQRRAARSKWPLRTFRAGVQPNDAFLHELSVEERLAALDDITETCWQVTGQGIEHIPRNRWPLKVVRRG